MIAKEPLSPEKRAMVDKANDNLLRFCRERSTGKSDWQILEEIIKNPSAPVVLGIWLDDAELDGIGIRVIKGDARSDRVLNGDDGQFDAILCRCPEEAEAMRQVFGEDRGSLN